MFTSISRASLFLSLTATLLLAGCQPQKPAPPPPSQETIDQQVSALRAQYQAVDPSAIVEPVVQTSPNDNLAAVQATVEEAAVLGRLLPAPGSADLGPTVTYLDLNGNVINHGIVLRIDLNHILVVRYNDPLAKRAPHVNDVMLYIKK